MTSMGSQETSSSSPSMSSKSHPSLTSQAGHGSSLAQAEALPSPSTEHQAPRSKKKKPKSEKSAVRNKDRGVWSCRHCGWEYPSLQPAAKERREHRRHCSSFQRVKVHDWLEKSLGGEVESDEAERYQDGLVCVEEDTTRQEDTAMVVGNSLAGGGQGQQSSDSEDKGGMGMEVGPQKAKQLTTGEDYVGDLEEKRVENGGTEEQEEVLEAKQPEEDHAGDSSQEPAEENQIVGNGEEDDWSSTVKLEEDEKEDVEGTVDKGSDPQEEQTLASRENANQQVNAEDTEDYLGKNHDGSLSEEHQGNEEERSSQQVENDVHKGQKILEEKPMEHLEEFQEKNEALSLSHENVEGGIQKKAYYPHEKGLASSSDKGVDVVTTAMLEHGAEEQLEQRIKQRIEFVEPKNTASSEITPLAENPFDYDVHLPKVLREQRTYDLLCPNCHSCITRRVILRKRKRTAPPKPQETEQQQKQPKMEEEPLAVPTGGSGTQQEEPEVEIETEEWQCLACFSVFFTKVREIRLPKLGSLRKTNLEVTEASTTEDGCNFIPFLLPDYAWDGDGNQVSQQPPVAHQRGPSCLPLRFPWSEGSTSVEQNEAPNSENACSCTPFLLPGYAWDGDGRVTSEDSTVAQQRPAERSTSSCLPLKLPWSSEEPSAVVESQGEGEIQDIEIFIDLRKRNPQEPKKSWIEKYLTSPSEVPPAPSHPDASAQVPATADVAQVHPASSEAEPPSSRAEDQSGFSCAPVLLPAYWNGAEEDEENRERLNCLPGVFPHYYGSFQPTGDAQVATGAQGNVNWTLWDGNNNCLPMLFTGSTSSTSAQGVGKPAEVSAGEVTAAADGEVTAAADGEVTAAADGEATAAADGEVSADEQVASEQIDQASCCIPAVLPFYGWNAAAGKKQAEASMEQNTETKETIEKDNKCLPITVPSYSWGGSKLEPEQLDIEAAGPEKRYLTTETRIQGFINTITNLITVRPKTGGPAAVVDSVQVGKETSYVDMKLTNQPEAVGGNKSEVLTTTPSTGWALVDALENEEDVNPLVDARRPQKTEARLSEIKEEDTKQDQMQPDTSKGTFKPHTEQQVGIETLLAIAQNQAEHQRKPLSTPEVPASTSVYVKGPGPAVLQVRGDHPEQTVDTAVSVAEDIGLIPAQPEAEVQGLEILKSIVYGGVEVSLASLAVVASGAGSDVKTLNLLAMGLANIIAGLIALLHTIGSLWLNDRCAFEERIGRRFWINGGISVVSFLVFGFVAPLFYAFSFRSSGDKDYKFAAAAGASLVCIVLLAIAKARVQCRSYRNTIASLVLTSFVAAVSGFFVGDFLKRWLHKLGLDIGDEATAPTAAPPPPWPFPFSDI